LTQVNAHCAHQRDWRTCGMHRLDPSAPGQENAGRYAVRRKQEKTMTHRRYWVYFLLFMFNVFCYLDRINMSVAGRSVAQEFVLSPVPLGYLFSSFLWVYVLMMLPSGRLVDTRALLPASPLRPTRPLSYPCARQGRHM
jgi:hypothetical protein